MPKSTIWSWRREQNAVESQAKKNAQVGVPAHQRYVASLEPAFLRILHRDNASAGEDTPHNLDDPSVVEGLSIVQSRALTGRQIDGIIKRKSDDLLGTKWLMTAQECWYRPPRPAEAMRRPAEAMRGSHRSWSARGAAQGQSAADEEPVDIAVLMVDNRQPFAYEVPGTMFRSPEGWGSKRTSLHDGWRPANDALGAFQFALVINHIYAQLHGYRFYLENPCPETSTGVDAMTWEISITRKQLQGKPFTDSLRKYHNSDPICPQLDATHRLGPFPPRASPWIKLSAIRYTLRRHHYVAYLDSDVHVTEVWQPLKPLLQMTGLLGGSKWIAAAEEFPPQKLRRDYRAGLANSGVLLLAGAPVAGPAILRAIEEWIWPDQGHPVWMFKWPYEQNALTNVVFRKYPTRYALLKPGCPINSPFGAFLRHMVGGTPSRKVYHPDHRSAWMLEALHCTLRTVTLSFTPRRPPERCTPNEVSLHLNASGCDQLSVSKDTVPRDPQVSARLRVADWESCCALCNAAPECKAWTFAWRWPNPMTNCFLLSGLSGTKLGMRDYVFAYKKPTPVRQLWTYDVPPPLFAPKLKTGTPKLEPVLTMLPGEGGAQVDLEVDLEPEDDSHHHQ